MSSAGGGSDELAGDQSTGRFIVSGAPGILAAVHPVLERDSTVRIVGVSPAPPAPPERLVLETSPSRAAELRAALGRALLIEPDEPVAPVDV